MVAAVSSTSPTGAPPRISAQQIQQMKQDWQDLSQALSSGDLASAQQAFSGIQDAQQQMGPPPGGANGAISQDFAALSSALDAGDVNAAKKAFATLQSDMQSLRPKGGPREGGGPEGGHGPGGGETSSSADKTVTNEVKQTNANGTVTITTTYSDGSTSTVTEQNPVPVAAQSPLDAGNSAQLQTLLAAQESASQA